MNTADLLAKIFNTRWKRHLLFWIFILFYFGWGYGYDDYSFSQALTNSAMHIPFFMLAIYPTIYILIPKLLFKEKYLAFFMSFAALVIAVAYLTHLIQDLICHIQFLSGFCRRLGNNITPLVKTTGMAASIKLIKYYYLKEQEAESEQSGKVEAELELLKSQIHPNFLFNTLNNLLAHTMKNSKESPDIVLKLSDLLRFMIYESRCNFIPLDHELELLRNFIGLEKLRHAVEPDISFDYSGDIGNKMIRPLLLLPLVENAFKQATAKEVDHTWVSIHTHVDGKIMEFKIANSRATSLKLIGDLSPLQDTMDNVKKRLELLYPDSHQLTISSDEDLTVLNLKLQLIDTSDLSNDTTNERSKTKYDLEMFVG